MGIPYHQHHQKERVLAVKQRIRKRSRWAHEPEKSNIVCSRCHKRGHNVRTCFAREDLVNQGDNENGIRESQSEEENMRDMDLS